MHGFLSGACVFNYPLRRIPAAHAAALERVRGMRRLESAELRLARALSPADPSNASLAAPPPRAPPAAATAGASAAAGGGGSGAGKAGAGGGEAGGEAGGEEEGEDWWRGEDDDPLVYHRCRARTRTPA